MSIITIRGLLGSGAPEIGKQVADMLSFDYIDREIIAKTAAQLGRSKEGIENRETPETSLLGRIVEALGRAYPVEHLGYPSAVFLPTWEVPLDDTSYIEGLKSVIKELAKSQSVVIRGRGSQFILRDFPEAFHVLAVVPLEVQVKRIMESMKLDEESAKKEIERFDGSHREFVRRYFHAEMENPANYDLVVNTEHLSFDSAASIVVHALHISKP